MTKKAKLAQITKEIVACRICKRGTIGKLVVGEGNPNAKIVFIGEAPGKTEAATGRPFVGRSGKLLRANIQAIGLDDLKDVYITSPVKYLPKQGTPSPRQIIHGRKHLLKQLAVIQPKVIVLMGSVAAQGVLGEKVPVAQRHGQSLKRGSQLYFFMYHPAAAIRFVKFAQTFRNDFKKLKKLLK